jgi:outer membrane protein assembly factor BamB
MIRSIGVVVVLASAVVGALGVEPAPQGGKVQLQLLWPLHRQAYQTNEWIDLSVVRSGPRELPPGDLQLAVKGDDGSKLGFTFPLAAVAAEGPEARRTEHLHLDGRLLRPGRYAVEVSAYGETARGQMEVYSHLRKSSFRIVDWASYAKGPEQAVLGEDSLGFNVLYASYGGLSPDDSIRGGLDYMWCCTMSGAHQMDIRLECDWSDPYVIRGGTARVVRRAFMDRVNPNAIGVHFYDEPGLTWHKHPATGQFTPHNVPAQERAYKSAFGREPLQYHLVKADKGQDADRWREWGRWKLSFMDAAWQLAGFGVNWVRPDFLPATQSVYGWPAYADGYYFNVVRSLPVISGHGGYDDTGGAYFGPSFTFEFGRARDLEKPNWYLPAWYAGMPSDRFRMEQYLSFMNNLQGMMKPPDLRVHRPATMGPTADGIVESNKLMARLGTIFTTMPVTRPDVAVLYSMSQNLHAQTRDMNDNYLGGHHAREKTLVAYLAGKLIHTLLFPIVEEDVLDGTLAAHHKVVVLPGINFLERPVIQALEDFSARGGAVLVSDDSQVKIKGATKVGAPADVSLMLQVGKLWEQGKPEEAFKQSTAGNYLKMAEPFARALQAQLQQRGIRPVADCDNPTVVLSRQALGDIEYVFAVNASYDAGVGTMNSIKPATAALSLPADGRPVYDAVLGGTSADFKPGRSGLAAELRFGPGQMRVFARSARPIHGVQVLTPTIFRDYTVAKDPLHVTVGAVVVDDKGRVLSGSLPLRIRLIDPLGVTRYDLYRATDHGTFTMNLPLAANDPAGRWTVAIQEMLANTEDTAAFAYTPPTQCGALAGSTPRAAFFGQDRQNIFRLFHTHQEVTIVKGTSAYNSAAAERLVQILKPWNIRCTVVTAAEAGKPREITAEEAPTWCGMEPGKVKPGRDNPPSLVGFNVRGAAILLGTPEDNPLIGFLQKSGFLPYRPEAANFPGRGRGMIAWQRDGVGYEQESVTLIAYDAKGMDDAVGSLYEAVASLNPLTRWVLASANTVTPASRAPHVAPEAAIAWKAVLPDRAAGLKALPNGTVVVLTQDGSLTALDARGKVAWQKALTGGDSWALAPSADGKLSVVGASQHVAGFDALGRQIFDVPLTTDKPVPVVTFVAASPDGTRIAAGADNGKLTMLGGNGKTIWTIGGVDPNDKKARPNPYVSGTFVSGGKTLVALNQNEVHVLSAADGKVEARAGGVNGVFAAQPAAYGLLLSDGRNVSLYSPQQRKVERSFALPDVGVASDVAEGEAVIVGTEVDGAVRKLKAAANGTTQTVWLHRVPGHVVKKVVAHGERTATAYWGGLVQVLDTSGGVVAERKFSQDVAAIDWLGDRLVVGLADGRLMALTIR